MSGNKYQLAAAKAKDARYRKTSAQIMRRQTSLVFPELMLNAAAQAVEAVEAGR